MLVLKLAGAYTSLFTKKIMKKNRYFLLSPTALALIPQITSSTAETLPGNWTHALHQPLDLQSNASPSRPSELLLTHCKNWFLNHMLVTPEWICYFRNWIWATVGGSRHCLVFTNWCLFTKWPRTSKACCNGSVPLVLQLVNVYTLLFFLRPKTVYLKFNI